MCTGWQSRPSDRDSMHLAMATACPLHLHGREIASIFELLGHNENDLTASLGWVLSRSQRLRQELLHDIGARDQTAASVSLQESADTGGYTDIEVRGEAIHCIVEAKKGWHLPTTAQLYRYVPRFSDGPEQHLLLVISECSAQYAATRLPTAMPGATLLHRSWAQIRSLVSRAARRAPLRERRLLAELDVYLRRAMSMQDQESNLVYVVALGAGTPEWSGISWRDIVNAKHRYFHWYAKGGWPLEPPNYLAFRYDGKLQSIHHVEDYEIVDRLHDRFAEVDPDYEGRHVVYTLGDPIRPAHRVSTGKIYRNGRVWAMIDLLLTCSTVAEARDRTKERQEALRTGGAQG
jgi:hypothetical protein